MPTAMALRMGTVGTDMAIIRPGLDYDSPLEAPMGTAIGFGDLGTTATGHTGIIDKL